MRSGSGSNANSHAQTRRPVSSGASRWLITVRGRGGRTDRTRSSSTRRCPSSLLPTRSTCFSPGTTICTSAGTRGPSSTSSRAALALRSIVTFTRPPRRARSRRVHHFVEVVTARTRSGSWRGGSTAPCSTGAGSSRAVRGIATRPMRDRRHAVRRRPLQPRSDPRSPPRRRRDHRNRARSPNRRDAHASRRAPRPTAAQAAPRWPR